MWSPAVWILAQALVSSTGGDHPRLLVVDLEIHNARADLRGPTTSLVVQAANATGRFDVVAGDDVRRALDLAANQQAAGCDSSQCLDQVAGALGARFVMFGDVSGVDDRTVLTLNLFDNEVLRSVARVSADISGQAEDSAVVDRLVRKLVREYDAYRGAFPVVPVVGFGGAAVALAGAGLIGVGIWQTLLLRADEQAHDRLVQDYLSSADAGLIDEAESVRQSADAHARTATIVLAVGVPVTAAALAACAWATFEAFE